MPDITHDREPDGTGRLSFRKYAAELHRYLLKRVARPADADDLAQEVFMRLLRLNPTERVRKPLAYLYGVASHVVHEFRIREEHDRVSYDSEAVGRLAENPEHLAVDEIAEQLDIQRRLERALAQLPRGQRAVLLLVKRDGLSHEEAAKASGLTVQTVEKYIVNAKARLRTMVQT